MDLKTGIELHCMEADIVWEDSRIFSTAVMRKKEKKVCQVCTRFTKGCLLSTSHIVYTTLVYSTFVFTAAVLGKQKFMLSFHSVLNQCIRKCEMSVRKLVPASHCVLLN